MTSNTAPDFSDRLANWGVDPVEYAARRAISPDWADTWALDQKAANLAASYSMGGLNQQARLYTGESFVPEPADKEPITPENLAERKSFTRAYTVQESDIGKRLRDFKPTIQLDPEPLMFLDPDGVETADAPPGMRAVLYHFGEGCDGCAAGGSGPVCADSLCCGLKRRDGMEVKFIPYEPQAPAQPTMRVYDGAARRLAADLPPLFDAQEVDLSAFQSATVELIAACILTVAKRTHQAVWSVDWYSPANRTLRIEHEDKGWTVTMPRYITDDDIDAVCAWRDAQLQPDDTPANPLTPVGTTKSTFSGGPAALHNLPKDPNAAMIERDGPARPATFPKTAANPPAPRQEPTPAGLLTLAPISKTGTSFGAWGAVDEMASCNRAAGARTPSGDLTGASAANVRASSARARLGDLLGGGE